MSTARDIYGDAAFAAHMAAIESFKAQYDRAPTQAEVGATLAIAFGDARAVMISSGVPEKYLKAIRNIYETSVTETRSTVLETSDLISS